MSDSVLQLNVEDSSSRKFISVQLPELCDEKSEAFKAGFLTISDVSKERIKKVSEKLRSESPEYKGDLGFKVLKLSDSNFKQWQQIKEKDRKALEEQMKLFVDPVAENATTENMVYELLLKSGKDLNSKIEKKEGFYSINDAELILLLEEANQKIIDTILIEKPQKVIALDKLFEGNDQLKTNASLQMKDADIEFKTI
jgi:adenine-specific DNA-methyltransferase